MITIEINVMRAHQIKRCEIDLIHNGYMKAYWWLFKRAFNLIKIFPLEMCRN